MSGFALPMRRYDGTGTKSVRRLSAPVAVLTDGEIQMREESASDDWRSRLTSSVQVDEVHQN